MLDEPSSALATPGGDATGATAARARAAWSTDAVEALFLLPFADLLFRAQQVHRAHHAADAVQLSTLLSIKTGGCPEDCGYCPQAARYHTGVASEAMLSLEAVLGAARAAKLLIRDMRNVSPHSLRISVGSPEQNDRLIRSIA